MPLITSDNTQNKDIKLAVYSSDLSAKCPKQRLLARQGLTIPDIPTAMYRGLLSGRAFELILQAGYDTSPEDVPAIVEQAVADTEQTINDEGRVLSPAVKVKDISLSVTEASGYFCERILTRLKAEEWDMVGTEVPIRWELDDNVDFCSHLDALFRMTDEQGEHWLILDFKWTAAMTGSYAMRHMQMTAYAHALHNGTITMDGLPCKTGANLIETSLVWTPALLPYKRKTSMQCRETGETQVYKKGDQRPMRSLWRNTGFWTPAKFEETEKEVRRQIMHRVQWIESNDAPMIPDPEGCVVCSSKDWCSWSGKETQDV